MDTRKNLPDLSLSSEALEGLLSFRKASQSISAEKNEACSFVLNKPTTRAIQGHLAPALRTNFPITSSIIPNHNTYGYVNAGNPYMPALQEQLNLMTSKEHMQQLVQIDVPTSVRVHEIEKALASKPQRGKKRDNLNQDERKELTRSRNRLHAKTTRLRKKQRHDELIDIEKSYNNLLKEQGLLESRKSAILEFQMSCTHFLNAFRQYEQTSDSVSNERTMNKAIEGKYESLFVNDASITITNVGGVKNHCGSQGLQAFFKDITKHDRDTKDNVLDLHYDFIILGSTDSIGVSSDGNAYCSYSIVGRASKDKVVAGVLHLKFCENCTSIAEMNLIIVENNIAKLKNSRERIPSVVSLERHVDK